MSECVFCAIVAGAAPALVVHEDVDAMAFLTIHPEVYGHTLIVPRAHFADLYDIPGETLGAVTRMGQRLARHYREVAGATGANLLHASGVDGEQSVFHFHFHLLPRFKDDGVRSWPALPGTRVAREDMHAKLRLA